MSIATPKRSFSSDGECVNVQLIERALRSGADVNLPLVGSSGQYPLMEAASLYNEAACRRLIEAGADLNAVGSIFQTTALGLVVMSLYPPNPLLDDKRIPAAQNICRLLMSCGADPRAAGDNSALAYAVAFDLRDITKTMVAHHIQWPQHLGSMFYYDDAGVLFADKATDLQPPLRHAIKWSSQDVIVRLLQLGADDAVLSEDMGKETPFQVAVGFGWNKVIDYYVNERGEDLGQRLANGRTLLQHAKDPDTREFLRSLKSTVAVSRAVDTVVDEQPAPIQRKAGLSPL